MTRDELIKKIRHLKQSDDFVAWASNTDGTPQELWDKCENGMWMLWLMESQFDYGSDMHRRIVLTGCNIRRKVLEYVTECEGVHFNVIDLRECWAKRQVTHDQLCDASDLVHELCKSSEIDTPIFHASYACIMSSEFNAAWSAGWAYSWSSDKNAGSPLLFDEAQKQYADVVRSYWTSIEDALS